MKPFYINKIVSIHEYCSTQSSWHTAAPRNVHFLAYHELGINDHVLKDKVFHVNPETLLFINKNDAYDVFIKEAWPSMVIVFDCDTDMESFVLDCSQNPQIKSLFKRIFLHRNIDDTSCFLNNMSLLYQIFDLTEKLLSHPYQTNTAKKALDTAFSYIQQHYTEQDISNNFLASLCHISTRRFVTIFKNQYGETPRQFILEKKIDEAARLLSTRLYNVTQVAEMVGFSDIYYFSKIFKKHMGITPSIYRTSLSSLGN